MNEQRKHSQSAANPDERETEELFLLHLRYKEAQLVPTGGNQPVLLNEKQTVWVVYTGRIDLFAVPLANGRIAGARTHLFRVKAGQALWGIDFDQSGNQLGLLAVGNKDTSLLKLPAARLHALSQDPEFGPQIVSLLDDWVEKLSHYLSPTLPPKDCLNLEAGRETDFANQVYASAKRGVLWIAHLHGQSYFMGRPQFVVNGQGYTPLSTHTWIETVADCRIQAQDTAQYLAHDPAWVALDEFHQLVLQHIRHKLQQSAQTDRQRLQNRMTSNQEAINNALASLANALIQSDKHTLPKIGQQPLLQACRLITEELGIALVEPPANRLADTNLDPLVEIARASRFQIRRVILKGRWWQLDGGPFLGYWEEGRQPVAILPCGANAYTIHDPVTDSQTIVDDKVVTTLSAFAIMFYRPLVSQQVSVLDLLKFGLHGRGPELQAIAFAGIAVSLLSLVIPIATGLIFNSIIPNAAQNQLLQLGLVMVIVALAVAMFQINQNIAILRLQGKMGTDLQAAVWSRLINLPASFFRDYSAGELGNRALGINTIQQTLSGPVMYALLSGVFSLSSFLLLFYYSPQLAGVATVLALIAVAVTIITGYKQVQYQRLLTKIQGNISGTVLQAITGITKFRTSGSEGRAFANWAKEFSQLKEIAYKSRNIANNLAVFNSGFTILAAIIIFAAVAMIGSDGLSTGDFLAFYAAFAQFLVAILALSSTLVRSLNIIPVYERARPILQTRPEIDELKEYPGELTGQIEINHASFRYRDDGPLILCDVSLEINPGAFVALVGPSGSGKSTLFRLLIGFEKPESGTIYYDGQDLTKMDILEVRRQIGVVLQNGKIMAGDIFTNIIGASPLTLDDAWEAARRAGLADDIQAMPMGMHTVISDGGGTLSGGQRQRLLIARALVNKPRIIFFDEATSALDNRTQMVVSESLENLQATRVVIAHRLSTIMNADHIYVMQNGRVVQQGAYKTLIKEDGLFANLAKRQMI